jgi:hypothetical protein
MSITDLAALVSQTLENAGITAVLSGGAAVMAYTSNQYASRDLDFVTSASLEDLEKAISPLGFSRRHRTRYFQHPNTEFFVEFPAGPLTVGNELVRSWGRISTQYGNLHILTPTQVVKDRLAAYFHWNDRQALDQATWVAKSNDVDMEDVTTWAQQEDARTKFDHFVRALK